MNVMVLLQILVVIGAIILGVQMGGIGLGLWGVAGVFVLVYVFGLAPGEPPTSAILIILAVITAAAAMQAAGGIDFLVQVASKIIRANPTRINYIAPLVSFIFTVGAGTSNIFFPLLPVIYQTAYDNGIRPERPLATSTVANVYGITCSPVSAAMAAMLTLIAIPQYGFTLGKVLAITIPSALIAILVMAFVQNRIGKSLSEDQEYQRRLREGLIPPPKSVPLSDVQPKTASVAYAVPAVLTLAGVIVWAMVAKLGNAAISPQVVSTAVMAFGVAAFGLVYLVWVRRHPALAMDEPDMRDYLYRFSAEGMTGTTGEGVGGGSANTTPTEPEEPELPKGAALSAYLFLAGVAFVVLSAFPVFQKMVPGAEGPEAVSTTVVIQMVMFVVALLIILFTKIDPKSVPQQPVFGSGIVAILALFGIAWLADTFVAAYNDQIVGLLSNAVTATPLLFAFAIFILAALTTSQSATTRTLVPIGLAILPVAPIVAMWQALSGVLFLPANGTQLAAVAVDETGTTKIGKAVVNHSFMIPLLISTVVAVVVGLLVAQFIK